MDKKPLGQMIIEMDLNSSKFTNSMVSVKRAVKAAQTEMKANMAVYDAAGDNLGKLQAQYDGLSKQLKVNKAYLEKLKQAYVDEVKASGKSSSKAQKLANDYNKQVTQVARVEKQLRATQKAINNFYNEGEQSVSKLSLAFGKLENKIHDVSKTMTKIVTPAIGGLGIAFGKVASDFDASGTHIENALDLTKEQLELAKKTAKTLYIEGFGESLEDVTNAIVQVKQNMKGLNDVDLSYATKSAITLGKEFDTDLNEVTRAGNTLMQNYGLTAQQAFDMMAKGAKNGMNFSNEMFDNMSEYTINFKEAGFSAKEMFAILSNGAKKGYNLDRLNDTLLEFKLQSEDSSKAYTSAMKSMSKDTQQVFKDYENGKATVSDLYKAVIPDLEKMRKTLPDKEFNTIGKALFGTKWEDQGADVVLSMSTVNKKLEDAKGTMNDMSANAEQSFGQRFQGVIRSTATALEPLGNTLLDIAEEAFPHVEKGIVSVTKWFDNMNDKSKYITLGILGIAAVMPPLGMAFKVVSKPIRIVWSLFDKIPNKGTKVTNTFNSIKNVVGKVIPSIDTLKRVASTTGKTLKTGLSLGAKGVIGGLNLLSKGFWRVIKVGKILAPFLRIGLGTALRVLTGPIGLVITGISLLTASFKYAYKHSERFRKFVDKLKDGITHSWRILKKLGVKGTVKLMWKYVTDKFGNGYKSIKDKVGNIKTKVSNTFEAIKDTVAKKVSSMIKIVKNMPSKMANGISKGASAMKSGAKKMLNGMISGVEWGINKVGGGINWILKKVGSETRLPKLQLARYAKGTDGHPGGLAMVNDAPDSNYRELITTPNGQAFIPKERNVIMNLPKGTKVLNGKETKRLGLIPKYAKGIGAIFAKGKSIASGAFAKVKDWSTSIWDWVDSKINIIKLLKNKIGNIIPIKFSGITPSLIKGVAETVVNKTVGWLLNKVEDTSGGNIKYSPSAGVNQWKNIAIRALKMTGQYSKSNLNRLLFQMSTESGGNPKAINLWDSNAKRGTPSKGLMQVIDPTFKAYAMKGYNKDIYDPLSNIIASIRYAVSRYGSLAKAYRGVGYANGGIITREHLAMVGEGNKPEAIIPLDISKRSRALQLLAQVVTHLFGGSSSSTSEENNAVLKTLLKQNEMMQQQINLLTALLNKDTNVYLDSKEIKKGQDRLIARQNKINTMARGLLPT